MLRRIRNQGILFFIHETLDFSSLLPASIRASRFGPSGADLRLEYVIINALPGTVLNLRRGIRGLLGQRLTALV